MILSTRLPPPSYWPPTNRHNCDRLLPTDTTAIGSAASVTPRSRCRPPPATTGRALWLLLQLLVAARPRAVPSGPRPPAFRPPLRTHQSAPAPAARRHAPAGRSLLRPSAAARLKVGRRPLLWPCRARPRALRPAAHVARARLPTAGRSPPCCCRRVSTIPPPTPGGPRPPRPSRRGRVAPLPAHCSPATTARGQGH